MASLKDMRNRIASVKATRKITKAMQMVAAAKLRRAQEAATAARPYAERMARVLANINATMRRQGRRLAAAGRHRQGRGAPAGRHDRRARPVRRLQHQHRPPRPRRMPCAWPGRARRSRSSASAARAPTPCAATGASRSSTAWTSRRVKQLGFANAEDIAAQDARAVRGRRVRRRHALLLRIQVGDRAEADRAAADPRHAAGRRGGRRRRKPQAQSTSSSPSEEEILAPLIARNIATQIFRGLLENAASEQGARMTAMDSATRNAGDMINKLTITLQPPAPGQHHQGADRDHLRRRGAVNDVGWVRPKAVTRHARIVGLRAAR